MGRREFIKLVGASAALSAAGGSLPAVAGPFDADDTVDHFVPADKKLKPEWIEAFLAKGARTVYRGRELDTSSTFPARRSWEIGIPTAVNPLPWRITLVFVVFAAAFSLIPQCAPSGTTP